MNQPDIGQRSRSITSDGYSMSANPSTEDSTGRNVPSASDVLNLLWPAVLKNRLILEAMVRQSQHGLVAKRSLFQTDIEFFHPIALPPSVDEEADKRWAELSERMSRLEAAAQGEQNTMEREIDSMIREQSYEELPELLDRDREKVVDILCDRTIDNTISLTTDEGKLVWRQVVVFHQDRYPNEVDSVYAKLVKCSRDDALTGIRAAIYEGLFAFFGGTTANVDTGYWVADKFAKRVVRKQLSG